MTSTRNYSPAIWQALDMQDMDAELRHEGNIAAHAYNVANGGGLEGIGLGWRGMDASTRFLVGIVDAVDAALDDVIIGFGSPGEDVDVGDLAHEIADEAASYAHRPLTVCEDLGSDMVDAESVTYEPGDDMSLDRLARMALYYEAYRIAEYLLDEAIANLDDRVTASLND